MLGFIVIRVGVSDLCGASRRHNYSGNKISVSSTPGIYPAHGLIRGNTIFVTEGLSEETMADLERLEILSPYKPIVLGQCRTLLCRRKRRRGDCVEMPGLR